jgi:hypothetical protein
VIERNIFFISRKVLRPNLNYKAINQNYFGAAGLSARSTTHLRSARPRLLAGRQSVGSALSRVPACECVASSQTGAPPTPEISSVCRSFDRNLAAESVSRINIAKRAGAKHKSRGRSLGPSATFHGISENTSDTERTGAGAAGKVINTGNELSCTAMRNTTSRSWKTPRCQSLCSGTRRSRFTAVHELAVHDFRRCERLQKQYRSCEMPKTIDPNEWYFEECPTDEIDYCWTYEYARESEFLRTIIAKWREGAKGNKIEEYIALDDEICAEPLGSAVHPFFPCWPNKPYLSIDPKTRKAWLDRLGMPLEPAEAPPYQIQARYWSKESTLKMLERFIILSHCGPPRGLRSKSARCSFPWQ